MNELGQIIRIAVSEAFNECMEEMGIHKKESAGYFTLAQAARYLDRQPQTLRNWVKEKKIRAFRMKTTRGLYFSKQELESLYTEVQFKYRKRDNEGGVQ
jgi:hypothetical protein